MKRIFAVLYIIMCSLPLLGEGKHALVFGLGKQKDTNWSKIHGNNDVVLVADMLTKAGFNDIRTLIDEQATKNAMKQAFLGLIRRCQKGDTAYIHYSGHGQYMTDVNGDEAERWTGRHRMWDESWIPYDAFMNYCESDKGDKHFCDDEIAELLTNLRKKVGKTGKIYVVIDACHSGDSTRETESITDSKTLQEELDEGSMRGVDVEFVMPRPLDMGESVKTPPEHWITISACKPYQLCFEHKSQKVGKLARALWLLGPKVFEMTNGEIQAWLDGYMAAHPARLPQTPVVSGNN